MSVQEEMGEDLKLGKLPAQPEEIKFELVNYVNVRAELPEVPPHFRHARPPKWEEYENGKYGNCVFAGACHQTLLWYSEGGMKPAPFTTESVLANYSAVTGFNPNDPKTDQGTNVADAASYWRRTGMLDAKGDLHRIDAYAKLRLGSMDYLRAALWLFGAVGLGFQFPKYAKQQFAAGEIWSVKSAWGWLNPDLRIVGGHYVAAIGIAENGNIITVSWGREQEMTPEFYLKYADEVLVCLDVDRINKSSKVSPQGFNEARLRRDLKLVTSGNKILMPIVTERTEWEA